MQCKAALHGPTLSSVRRETGRRYLGIFVHNIVGKFRCAGAVSRPRDERRRGHGGPSASERPWCFYRRSVRAGGTPGPCRVRMAFSPFGDESSRPFSETESLKARPSGPGPPGRPVRQPADAARLRRRGPFRACEERRFRRLARRGPVIGETRGCGRGARPCTRTRRRGNC